jgi:hypothetical protein
MLGGEACKRKMYDLPANGILFRVRHGPIGRGQLRYHQLSVCGCLGLMVAEIRGGSGVSEADAGSTVEGP